MLMLKGFYFVPVAAELNRYTESVDVEVPAAPHAGSADADAAFQTWLGQLPASPGAAGLPKPLTQGMDWSPPSPVQQHYGLPHARPPGSSGSVMLNAGMRRSRGSDAENGLHAAAVVAQRPREGHMKPVGGALETVSSMGSMFSSASTATLESLEGTLSGMSIEGSRQHRLSSIDEGS